MYSAIDLVTQQMQQIEQQWERYNPRNISEIEILVQKREKDAKLTALSELLKTLKKRDSMIVLTKENTEVKWLTHDDEDNEHRHAIIKNGDFELTFNRIGYHFICVKDDNDYYTDISLEYENDFARHDSSYIAPAFFIEKTFLLELSDLADEFMECEECGYPLNNCQCCGECGKYECECEYCRECGWSFDECKCDEDDE